MDETIERIIQKEYVMLGKVNNRGGRAACQDHFALFRTMRASQFLVWPDSILRSYLDDLKQAEAVGRNLVFEKYAWMMMYALPEEFKKVCHVLPVFSPERRERMQETVAVQVAWAEEFPPSAPAAGRCIQRRIPRNPRLWRPICAESLLPILSARRSATTLLSSPAGSRGGI